MQTKHGNEEQYDELVTHFMINDNLWSLIKPEMSRIEAGPPPRDRVYLVREFTDRPRAARPRVGRREIWSRMLTRRRHSQRKAFKTQKYQIFLLKTPFMNEWSQKMNKRVLNIKLEAYS